MRLWKRSWRQVRSLSLHGFCEPISPLTQEYQDDLSNKSVDLLLINAIRWPSKNRKGQPIDNAKAIEMILAFLEVHPFCRAGYSVWKEIILAASKGAKLNSKRWELVRRSLIGLSLELPSYWPDQEMLQHGLKSCESLSDSKLASELISRMASHVHQRQTYNDSDSLTPFSVSAHDLTSALNICLKANDLESFRSVLESLDSLRSHVPIPSQQKLFELGIKGFVAQGDPETAEALLLAVVDNGVQPR